MHSTRHQEAGDQINETPASSSNDGRMTTRRSSPTYDAEPKSDLLASAIVGLNLAARALGCPEQRRNPRIPRRTPDRNLPAQQEHHQFGVAAGAIDQPGDVLGAVVRHARRQPPAARDQATGAEHAIIDA